MSGDLSVAALRPASAILKAVSTALPKPTPSHPAPCKRGAGKSASEPLVHGADFATMIAPP